MKDITELNNFIWDVDNFSGIEQYGVHVQGLFVPFWMLVRFQLSDFLLTLLGYGVMSDSVKRMSWRDLHIINAYRHRLRAEKADVLFLSPSVGNIISTDGSVENIYHDAFIRAFSAQGKKVLVLEQTEFWQCFKKIRATPYAYSLTFMQLIRKVKEHLLARFIPLPDAEVEHFIKCLDALLAPYLAERAAVLCQIKIFLVQQLRSLRFRVGMWEKVIRMVQPKILMMQDVCFGGAAGLIALIFKKHNVVVIEDQHGIINEDHIAYRYGAGIINKPLFTRFFPDYFFAYGSRWLESINIDMKKMVVGNARLTQAQQGAKDSVPIYDFLVLADSERPQLTNERLAGLMAVNYRILFRPHPREWSVVAERYRDFLVQESFTLDQDRDIYRSILKTKIVICFPGNFLSTVAYEALALGKPVVCCRDHVASVIIASKAELSPYIYQYEHIEDLLKDLPVILARSGHADLNLEHFYHPDWDKNFVEVMQTLGL
jgi:hypothetical protein